MTPVHPTLRELKLIASHDLMSEYETAAARLFMGSAEYGSDRLTRHAVALAHGPAANVTRTALGQPWVRDERCGTRPLSISAAGERRAVLVAAHGRVGVDIETLDRVRLNTTAEDGWLDPAERRMLRSLDPVPRLLEVGCRWVLREAYGKAVGLGLSAWTERHTITAERGVVRVHGAGDGWRFSLYRQGSLLIATAGDCMSGGQAVRARGKESAVRAGRQAQRLEHL